MSQRVIQLFFSCYAFFRICAPIKDITHQYYVQCLTQAFYDVKNSLLPLTI